MNPLRILLVQHEALLARDLQTTLVKLGYGVCGMVRTMAEALRVARSDRPGLALIDTALADAPGGWAMVRDLQMLGIPVIYLASHRDEHAIPRARATQPYGCLIQPFHEQELPNLIELCVARHTAQSTAVAAHVELQNTLASLPEGVIATDLLGQITFVNQVAERLTGWSATEALGRSLAEVFKIATPEGEALKILPTGVKPGPRTMVLTRRDGLPEMVEDHTAPIREADGTLAGIVVSFHQLAVSLEGGTLAAPAPWQQLSGLVQSIADPMVALDAGWKLTYLNPQAAAVLQAPREELVGRVLWDCLPPSVHQRYYYEFSQALAKRQTRTFAMEIEATQQWFEVQLNPFGEGLLALVRDITVRKREEEQGRKMEKLESLGLLARGFAHDFNNLLTVLLGNLSLAEIQTTPAAPGHAELLTAKQATLQAQGLVQHLLIFARGGVPVKQVTDFGRLVKEWVHDWPRQEGVSYVIEISPQAMQAEVDRQQFLRLLHNLLRNAEQAVTVPATVTLRLRPATEGSILDVPIDLTPDQARKDWLLLEVADTGCGIPLEDQARVFEPYFTTRDEDHATGLGLTVCESIAKAHGATISVRSEAETGTTFTVCIPAYQPPIIEIRPDHLDLEIISPVLPERGPRRVLILEDEPLIRQLMCATLKSIGCEVDQTKDGAETIARYADAMEQGSPYQLLIMDLSIPNGMGGVQALDRILQVDPKARAIVSSGYCDDPVLSRYMDYGFQAVLPKPYQPQDLQQMVETMLAK